MTTPQHQQQQSTATVQRHVRSLVTHAAWRILAPRFVAPRNSFFEPNHQAHYMPPPPEPPVIQGFIPWLIQALQWALAAFALLLVSSATYAVLYHTAMPAPYATVPLYFDYQHNACRQAAAGFVAGNVQNGRSHTRQDRWRRMASSFEMSNHRDRSHQDESDKELGPRTVVPTAMVDLWGNSHSSGWEVLYDIDDENDRSMDRPFHSTASARPLLTPRQAYYLEVALVLPESLSNRQGGLFGVVTELAAHVIYEDNEDKAHDDTECISNDANMTEPDDDTFTETLTNATCDTRLPRSNTATKSQHRRDNGKMVPLARSTRWTQLPHVSAWIRTSFQAATLVLHWMGALTEVQTVVVPAFRHYVEAPRRHGRPLRYVTVNLNRYDPQHQPVVEVVRAEVRIGKELSALQHAWREWYYTSFVVGTAVIAAVYLVAWSALLERWRHWRDADFLDPDCELDFDMDMGLEGEEELDGLNEPSEHDGEGPEEHGQASGMRRSVTPPPPGESGGEDPERREPHFEDWQESAPPPGLGRGPTQNMPSTGGGVDASFSHPYYHWETSDSQWEDIVYTTHNGNAG